MVKQVIPAVAVRTLEAQMLARTCTGDHCVWSQVNIFLSVDSDGSHMIAYHDAADPMRNAQVAGNDCCQREIIGQMLDAIADLAPEQP